MTMLARSIVDSIPSGINAEKMTDHNTLITSRGSSFESSKHPDDPLVQEHEAGTEPEEDKSGRRRGYRQNSTTPRQRQRKQTSSDKTPPEPCDKSARSLSRSRRTAGSVGRRSTRKEQNHNNDGVHVEGTKTSVRDRSQSKDKRHSTSRSRRSASGGRRTSSHATAAARHPQDSQSPPPPPPATHSSSDEEEDEDRSKVADDEANVLLKASSAATVQRRGRSRDKGKNKTPSNMAQAYVDAKNRSQTRLCESSSTNLSGSTHHTATTPRRRMRKGSSAALDTTSVFATAPTRSSSHDGRRGISSRRLPADPLSSSSFHGPPPASSTNTNAALRRSGSLSTSMHKGCFQLDNDKNSKSRACLIGLSSSIHGQSTSSSVAMIKPSARDRRPVASNPTRSMSMSMSLLDTSDSPTAAATVNTNQQHMVTPIRRGRRVRNGMASRAMSMQHMTLTSSGHAPTCSSRRLNNSSSHGSLSNEEAARNAPMLSLHADFQDNHDDDDDDDEGSFAGDSDSEEDDNVFRRMSFETVAEWGDVFAQVRSDDNEGQDIDQTEASPAKKNDIDDIEYDNAFDLLHDKTFASPVPKHSSSNQTPLNAFATHRRDGRQVQRGKHTGDKKYKKNFAK